MNNRRFFFVVLIGLLVAGLAAAVGIYTFRLGQQMSAANSIVGNKATGVAVPTATAAGVAVPPPIVTNTPTSTRTPTPTRGPTDTPTPTPTYTPSPTPTPIVVITHINTLGRLETAEFVMRTTLDLENEPNNLWENIFGTDKLTLIAEGEVVAGIDLNKVKPEDITVRETTVNIRLPAPEILYSRIDNQNSFVYERRTGLFRQIDKTLESRARLLAEQSLVDWSIQRGIYKKAEEAGRTSIEKLLRSLGFTEIVIQFKPEPL